MYILINNALQMQCSQYFIWIIYALLTQNFVIKMSSILKSKILFAKRMYAEGFFVSRRLITFCVEIDQIFQKVASLSSEAM